MWTDEASRVALFYSGRSASAVSAHSKRVWKPQNLIYVVSAIEMAGVSAGVMSVAGVRSVVDAETLLAQLDREEVSL